MSGGEVEEVRRPLGCGGCGRRQFTIEHVGRSDLPGPGQYGFHGVFDVRCTRCGSVSRIAQVAPMLRIDWIGGDGCLGPLR